MIRIGGKTIGPGNPCFIVAEVSGNHNGDIRRAMKIIDAAAAAGADAVKLQTYTPQTMTIESDRAEFVIKTKNAWKGRTLYDLYAEAHTPWAWHSRLFAHAKKKGLICFSTPFDPSAVTFLQKLRNPIYKVASFEIVDTPLLKAIARTRKPVIMSRGMASLPEIRRALSTLKKHGCPAVVVLHCVSAYPAAAEGMRLATIPDIRKRFRTLVGLSDHSLSNDVAIAAVALGASVLEKHLTLRREDGGPDASFSLEPKEFRDMVQSIRTVEVSIGKPSYGATPQERANVQFRRSLFAVEDIKKGDMFTKKNVRVIRPGFGLPPEEYAKILGSRARADIARGTPMSRKLVARSRKSP